MINKIKNNFNLMKEAYQASYEISSSLVITPEKTFYICGETVYYYPKMLKASGTTVIMVDKMYRIFVDDNFLKLSAEAQEALVMHEMGHIHLRHLENIKLTNSFKRIFKSAIGEVQDIELEADKFAHDNGFSMIQALHEMKQLEYVKQFKNTIKEINNRISVLESYKK